MSSCRIGHDVPASALLVTLGTAAGGEAKSIKILTIGCSPKEQSSTTAALQICLDAAKAVAPEHIEVELITVAGSRPADDSRVALVLRRDGRGRRTNGGATVRQGPA